MNNPRDELTVLDDPGVDAFGMLIEAHNELNHAVTRRLSDVEVPVPWLGVLIRLARTPDRRLRMAQLAKEMTMSTSGLTRLIDRLEDAGFVSREACPEDRRGTWAVLTPAGMELMATVAPGHVQDLRELLADALSKRELTALTDLLRTVRDHVRSVQ